MALTLSPRPSRDGQGRRQENHGDRTPEYTVKTLIQERPKSAIFIRTVFWGFWAVFIRIYLRPPRTADFYPDQGSGLSGRREMVRIALIASEVRPWRIKTISDSSRSGFDVYFGLHTHSIYPTTTILILFVFVDCGRLFLFA